MWVSTSTHSDRHHTDPYMGRRCSYAAQSQLDRLRPASPATKNRANEEAIPRHCFRRSVSRETYRGPFHVKRTGGAVWILGAGSLRYSPLPLQRSRRWIGPASTSDLCPSTRINRGMVHLPEWTTRRNRSPPRPDQPAQVRRQSPHMCNEQRIGRVMPRFTVT